MKIVFNYQRQFMISLSKMETINKKFLKPYEPKNTEDRIYKRWENGGFFNPDNLPSADHKLPNTNYSIVIAPPNITGSLHLGHALENVQSDILIRFYRMKGRKTLWLPGMDHAGIATQNVVEKSLKKENLTRHDLGKEKFLQKIWEWKEEYGETIPSQLKKLGCSLDWSRIRFTMDENYQEAVKVAFKHYHEKGLIYQGDRVINWCVKDQTALSDLEIEYEEEKSKLWYLKYPLSDQSGFVTVATTRPETMLGDAAIAVHPEDLRYKNLIGKKVLLPILEREIPIITDDQIEKEFGTGAVKITPAHDIFDSEVAERHSLPYFKIINEVGKIIDVSEELNGKKFSEVRELVIAKLKDLNLIEKEEDFTHNVAKCYRCGKTIEPLLSKQWFLKMKPLAEKAIKAIENGEVRYHPEKWSKVSLDWLYNVKDWCISRQIWWGHKVPIEGSEDTFDTWFSSALWPFASLGWPRLAKASAEADHKNDLEEFYPTQVITSARDILHLWISRMIFSGLEFTGKVPFKDVVIHATILTKDGKRMSKSLGTGIDPLDLIEKYGADALRFGLVYQALGGQDIRFAEDHVAMGKKFCNKLWNISRFVVSKTGGKIISDESQIPNVTEDSEEFKILKLLEICKKEVSESIESFRFGEATHLIYDFVWREFADKFIEYSKEKESETTKATLSLCLSEILKILHPFTPFITEEIWSVINENEEDKMLILENWE